MLHKDTTADRSRNDLLEELYTTHSRKLLRFTMRYIRDKSTAEQILQDTFIKIISCLDKLRGFDEKESYNYLCKAAYHLAMTYLDNLKKHPTEDIDEMTTEIADNSMNIEDLISRLETCSIVRDMIDRLSPRIKQVILMYYCRELSAREVADYLHISPNVVNVRLKRGRDQLNAWLSEVEGEPYYEQ